MGRNVVPLKYLSVHKWCGETNKFLGFGKLVKKSMFKPMYFRLVPIECFQFLWRNSNETTGNFPPNNYHKFRGTHHSSKLVELVHRLSEIKCIRMW